MSNSARKFARRTSTGVLAAVVLAVSVPFTAQAAAVPPVITGAYQSGNHAKLEWSIDMADNDVLARTGFEQGDTYELGGPSNNLAKGNLSVQSGDAAQGSRYLNVTDNKTRNEGNVYWYPQTESDISGVGTGNLALRQNSVLAVQYKARATSGTINDSVFGLRGEWLNQGFPMHDWSGRNLLFGQTVAFTPYHAESIPVVVEGGGVPNLPDGHIVALVGGKNTDRSYGVGIFKYVASTQTFIPDPGSPAYFFNTSSVATGQPTTPNVTTFNQGEPILWLLQTTLPPFSTRRTEADGVWHTYTSTTTSAVNEPFYHTDIDGFYSHISMTTNGNLQIDDIKFGYASEAELFRDGHSVYRGYISDFDDTGATDKDAPSMVSGVTASVLQDRKLQVDFSPALDRGTTYRYQLNSYPTSGGVGTSAPRDVEIKAGVAGYAVQVNTSPVSAPSSTINTSTPHFTYQGNLPAGEFYVHVNAVDAAGNVSAVSTYKYAAGQSGGTVNPDTTEWTNGSVLLTARGTSSSSWVDSITKPDNETVAGDTATYSAIQNGTYSFIVKSHDGSEATITREVSNIDKQAPIINAEPDRYAQKNAAANETDQLSFALEDVGGSGIASVQGAAAASEAELQGSGVLAALTPVAGAVSVSVPVGADRYVRLRLVDHAGNVADRVLGPYRIEAPAGAAALAVSARTSSSVDLTAVPLQSQVGPYQIEFENLSTGQSVRHDPALGPFTVSGLSPQDDTQYRARVVNETSQGAWSEPVRVYPRLAAVTGLTINYTDFDSTAAAFSFDPVPGATEGYRWSLSSPSFDQEYGAGTVTESVYNSLPALTAGTVYTLGIAPEKEGKVNGDYAYYTFKSLSGALQGFTAVGVSNTRIDLSWQGLDGALGYGLQKNGQEWVPSHPSTTLSDEDVLPATDYDYTVAAISEEGIGDQSNLSVTTAPDAPMSLKASEVDQTSARLTWDAVPGATGYFVQIDDAAVPMRVTDTSYSAEGFGPGTQHTVRVVSANEYAGGGSSVSWMTLPAAVEHEGIQVTDITTTSAKITVPSVPGADRYRITYGDQVIESSEGVFQLQDLPAGAGVTLTVQSGNESGWSDGVTVDFDLRLVAPGGFKVTDRTATSATLTWLPVPGAVSYRITGPDGAALDVDGDQTSIELNELPAGGTTVWRIVAVNTAGNSEESEVSFRTLPGQVVDKEGKPLKAVVEDIGVNTADLSWSAVPGADRYRVLYGSEELGVLERTFFTLESLPSAANITTVQVVPVNSEGEGYAITPDDFVTKPSAEFKAAVAAGSGGLLITFTHGLTNEVFVVQKGEKEIYRGKDREYVDKTSSGLRNVTYKVYTENERGDSSKAVVVSYVSPPQESGGAVRVPVDEGMSGKPSVPVKQPVTAPTPAPAPIPVVNPNYAFSDIGSTFSRDAIQSLYDLGFVNGDGTGKFRPGDSITRMEFAAMLVRVLKLSEEQQISLPYQDIRATAWYVSELRAAKAGGIAEGISRTEFAPDLNINREQAARMLVNATFGNGVGSSGSLLPFSDKNSVSEWAITSLTKAVEEGLVRGFPDGTYRPKEEMTRGEAAVLVSRMLQKK